MFYTAAYYFIEKLKISSVVLVYLGFGLYEYTGVILYIILLKQAESLTQVCQECLDFP